MDIFEKTKGMHLISLLKSVNLYPYLREIEGTSGSQVIHKGSELIMLGSNNYLGLTHHPQVIEASKNALDKWGTGCTGSRFLNGNLSLHQELEETLSNYLGYEDCLVFASGFMANQGAIQAITDENDFIFSDSDNHACIIEGCAISKASTVVFESHDMEDLERKLQSVPHNAGKLIISDGVFSMNGSIVNLPKMKELADKYSARLYIDEAHSLGTIGKTGKGSSEYYDIMPDILMGTFSKSLASQGGFIAASTDVIDWIKHKGKTFMFSAALAPAATAAALEALKILIKTPELVKEVNDKAAFLKKGFDDIGFDTMGSKTCVIPILIGDDKLALKLSSDLIKRGVFVTPVVFPAVPKGQALIRCSVMATHTKNELQKAVEIMKDYSDLILNQKKSNQESLHQLLDANLNAAELRSKLL